VDICSLQIVINILLLLIKNVAQDCNIEQLIYSFFCCVHHQVTMPGKFREHERRAKFSSILQTAQVCQLDDAKQHESVAL